MKATKYTSHRSPYTPQAARRPRFNKGVSPIIATLLLIVIAVAAAVVTYAFVAGFIGQNLQNTNTGINDRMSFDAIGYNSTSGTITAVLRNTGTTVLHIDVVYLYTNGAATGFSTEINATIATGTTYTINDWAVGNLKMEFGGGAFNLEAVEFNGMGFVSQNFIVQ